MLLYNRLKNRLDDAVLLSRKEVRWNYHTAIPSYYPSRNTMNFMLPLHLSSDDAVDIVLVVELTPAGNYQGQTILTCDQAYIDARLVCRLKSHDRIKSPVAKGIYKLKGETNVHQTTTEYADQALPAPR